MVIKNYLCPDQNWFS